jgi:hypothetical protein
MGKRLKGGRVLMTVSKRTADILDGLEDLSAWDDEELLRGQRRDRNGNFTGVPPKVVPQVVHAQRVRRTMSKAHEILRVSTVDALELLRDVVNDLDAPLPSRLQAAQLILDRTIPKTADVNLTLSPREEPPWLAALKGALTIVPGDERDEYTLDDVLDVESFEADEVLVD